MPTKATNPLSCHHPLQAEIDFHELQRQAYWGTFIEEHNTFRGIWKLSNKTFQVWTSKFTLKYRIKKGLLATS